VTSQLSLFGETRVEVRAPEKPTLVRVGKRAAEIPLYRRRREALTKLMATLRQLEGKDIFIGWCGGGAGHFWLNHLRLGRLQVETFDGGDKLPIVIHLWGQRDASVRIFTDQVVDLREQDCFGYTLWLVDFWNGFSQHPINPYRPGGYQSLEIARFKD